MAQKGKQAYSESCQIFRMEVFAELVNGFQPLFIFDESSILVIWQVSEHASESGIKNVSVWIVYVFL